LFPDTGEEGGKELFRTGIALKASPLFRRGRNVVCMEGGLLGRHVGTGLPGVRQEGKFWKGNLISSEVIIGSKADICEFGGRSPKRKKFSFRKKTSRWGLLS